MNTPAETGAVRVTRRTYVHPHDPTVLVEDWLDRDGNWVGSRNLPRPPEFDGENDA
jgi:hypothetical protein